MPAKPLTILITLTVSIFATDHNTTQTKKRLQKEIQKQMALEKKYAKEQRFYQGDAYDLKSKEIDPEILKNVKVIEPDYEHTDDWGVADSE